MSFKNRFYCLLRIRDERAGRFYRGAGGQYGAQKRLPVPPAGVVGRAVLRRDQMQHFDQHIQGRRRVLRLQTRVDG